MSRRKHQEKRADPKLAIASADAFLKHSTVFLEKIGTDIHVANERALQDLGGLVSSATMRALSVELYIKALRILSGLTVPDTHHLWSLYKHLPEKLKNSIEETYDRRNPKEGNECASLQVAIHVGLPSAEAVAELERKGRASESQDVKGILLRSSDAFLTWRYLHEKGSVGEFMIYEYEFSRLGIIAEVLRAHAVNALPKISQTPQQD